MMSRPPGSQRQSNRTVTPPPPAAGQQGAYYGRGAASGPRPVRPLTSAYQPSARPALPPPSGRPLKATYAGEVGVMDRINWRWLAKWLGIMVASYLLIGFLIGMAVDGWNTLAHGYPRRTSIAAQLGYKAEKDNSTQSIIETVNQSGQLYIIIEPGGDLTQERTIRGPQLSGSGSDKVVASVTVRDTNGDGWPDLILAADGQSWVYLNNINAATATADEFKAPLCASTT